MRYLKKAFFVLFSGLILAEVAVRILGIANVPIRSANSVTGYIPLPNQSGRFLLNDWYVNNLSMISHKNYSKKLASVIIAGDSVIFGGNAVQQSDRVGEQLDLLVKGQVFSIADGSWGGKNSIAYFLSSKSVIGSPKEIIFVLNSGDFDKPSSWRCYSTHSTSQPISHLYFAIRKYGFPQCEVKTPNELIAQDFDFNAGLKEFLVQYPHTAISIILYPTRSELRAGISFKSKLKDVKMKFSQRIDMFDLSAAYQKDNSIWGEHLYRDDIHPTAQGNKALAAYIFSNVL